MFLTVKDLKKSYGSTSNKVEVLKGINFEVEKGEICVLLGPSGSGKSAHMPGLRRRTGRTAQEAGHAAGCFPALSGQAGRCGGALPV